MENKELKKLIEESKNTDLGTLISAKEAAKRLVLDDPSPSNLVSFERASRMLEDIIDKEETAFKNRMEVLRHLQGRGIKIHRSKLYNDCNKGLLKIESDGSVLESSVENYINHPASQLSCSNDHPDHLQQEKFIADIKRARAQADHWDLKTNIAKGLYIERVTHERDLAARAIVLKSDMENFIRSSSGKIIKIVGGDPSTNVDLIEFMLGQVESWFDRYAERREFNVSLEQDQVQA